MEPELLEFISVFFAESEENLADLEAGLLEVERGASDSQLVGKLFRSAHTLKGNAATFGFSAVVKLTHTMENLLDDARAGRRVLTPHRCEAMLKAVDTVRQLLAAASDNAPEPSGIDLVHQSLQDCLADAPVEQASAPLPPLQPAAPPTAPGPDPGSWKIRFVPYPELLSRGNDVVLILRALGRLGNVVASANLDRLPSLASLEPERCYLSWDIDLLGNVPYDQVHEIFEWVDDLCDLEIAPVGAGAVSTPQKPAPQASGPDAAGGKPDDVQYIRVDSAKIEQLINMVGELVITQSMLGKSTQALVTDELQAALERLDRNTRDLRDTVLQIRMVPIGFAFNRLPRLVRDLGRDLGKRVDLKLEGAETELDKSLLERLVDPLMHLVRNCIDHGVERPEARRASGKSETGVVSIKAYHQAGSIVVEVSDDGAGIDVDRLTAKAHECGLDTSGLSGRDLLELIFHPGLSTAPQVSEISGRGVGMDVVRRNVLRLGGNISVASEEGQGTRFLMRLPLTLAILDGQQVRIGQEVHIIPMFSIVECLQLKEQQLRSLAGERKLCYHRDRFIPLLNLYEALGIRAPEEEQRQLAMVVEWAGQRAAVMVDELLDQQQVVVKSLEKNYGRVEGVLGTTILGDGTVSLILDLAGFIQAAAPSRNAELEGAL